MNRREFLSRMAFLGAAGVAAGPSFWLRAARAADDTSGTTSQLAMVDWDFANLPPNKIQKRFDLYQQIGFGSLGIELGWRMMERKAGEWIRTQPFVKRYLEQAIRSGFRLKFRIGTAVPPKWWYEAHPDAHILNARGQHGPEVSPWYPGLEELLVQKTDTVFNIIASHSGLMGATDFIFADLGPAGEGLYPVSWVLAAETGEKPELLTEKQTVKLVGNMTPWYYDANAQASFAKAMKEKYSSVAAANREWGSNFMDWSDVRPPLPGEYPGPMWREVFFWYRDSKRAFIRFQINNYRQMLSKYSTHQTQLIIPVGGGHYSEQEIIDNAMATAQPDPKFCMVSDIEFLLNLGQETGCRLHNTGCENWKEVAWQRAYMKAHDIRQSYEGENAGVERVALYPDRIVDSVLSNGLVAFDYIHGNYLFEPDRVTPNETYYALGRACQRLRQAWG